MTWNADVVVTADTKSDRRIATGRYRFDPAPKWPAPPPGWSPQPGWRPDPTWDTPPDWVWMRRTPRSPAARLTDATGLIVKIAVGAVAALIILAVPVGFTALVILEAAASAEGRSVDPTDPANFDEFALHNDTPTTLYTRLCDNPNCTAFEPHDKRWGAVNPGNAATVQVYWGPTTPTLYAVSDTPDAEAAQRCIALDAHVKSTITTPVALSSTVPCGN